MNNIFIRQDPAGNIKADKEKSTGRIDGAIATIMALYRDNRCGLDDGTSVYDTRGLFTKKRLTQSLLCVILFVVNELVTGKQV